MVVKEVEEAVSKASQPAKAAVVGVLGALAGLPLIILVPVLLVMIGVGIYVVVTLMPFIVAGAVFILAFYLARWIKLKEPWNVLVPVGSGLVAILPHFVSSLSQPMIAISSALADEGLPSYSLTPFAFVTICVFLALMAAGAYSFIKRGEWSALGVSLAAVALMLAIVPGLIGTSPGSAIATIEGQPTSTASFDPLIIVLLVGIAIAGAVHWRQSFGAR